jgi:hypothetical protein
MAIMTNFALRQAGLALIALASWWGGRMLYFLIHASKRLTVWLSRKMWIAANIEHDD